MGRNCVQFKKYYCCPVIAIIPRQTRHIQLLSSCPNSRVPAGDQTHQRDTTSTITRKPSARAPLIPQWYALHHEGHPSNYRLSQNAGFKVARIPHAHANQHSQADASSPVTSDQENSSIPAKGGSTSVLRASSPPGGPRSAIRRRAAADHKETVKNARPSSTRAAGAGGSSGTMLRLYTDESPGLKVDPMVILFLSLGFIFSVVALHCECNKF